MSEHILYILSGTSRGPIYISSTGNLDLSMRQHKAGRMQHAKFRIDQLVYTERFTCPLQAQARVKALRAASRQWIESVITARNPSWQDLSLASIEEAQLVCA